MSIPSLVNVWKKCNDVMTWTSKQNVYIKTLSLICVWLLLFTQISPALILHAEEESGVLEFTTSEISTDSTQETVDNTTPSPQADTNIIESPRVTSNSNISSTAENTASSIIDSVLSDPAGYSRITFERNQAEDDEEGPSDPEEAPDTDEDKNDENTPGNENGKNGNTNNDTTTEEQLSQNQEKPTQDNTQDTIPDDTNSEDTTATTTDGTVSDPDNTQPSGNESNGEDTTDLTEPTTPENAKTESSGGGGGSFEIARPDISEIFNSVPRTSDEALEIGRRNYDQQEITTDDQDTTATTDSDEGDKEETTTEDAGTITENTVDGDDNTALSGAETEDGVVIDSENVLEQNNITTGESNTGDNVIESEEQVLEATITTGDAGISSSNEVQGNTNNISTGSSGGGGGGGSGWTQRIYGDAGASNAVSGDGNDAAATAGDVKELVVVNKNLAFVSNIKELLAKTGGNRISAVERFKDGGIYTGDTQTKSSLLNIINTNTVDSAFLPLTFDLFDTYTGNINILDILFEAFGANLDGPGAITATAANENTDTSDSSGTAYAGAFENVQIVNDNEGYIFNDLDIANISGQNQIITGRKAKELEINTGDNYIANNLINILNNSLYKSKVGVIVINVFADWSGNLILPGASKLASSIADPAGATASTSSIDTDVDDSLNNALAITNSTLDVINEHNGKIQSEINITANTGENLAVFDKDGEDININTGETDIRTNMLTLANRSVIGTAFSHGFFNILGDWTGSVIGTPETALTQGSKRNFIIADEAAALAGSGTSADASNTASDIDESTQSAVAEVNRSVSINNKDDGTIVNRLNILGDSGHNDVASYKGNDIEINTGDVGIANNISNFMNNSFSFSKGLTIALNVFGEWQGNIAYDEIKDLGVDIDVEQDTESLSAGSTIGYTVSAVNRGTENTDPNTIRFTYDPNKYDLISAAGGAVSGNTISWPVPSLESAGRVSFTPIFRVKPGFTSGSHNAHVEAVIDSTDANTNNDQDTHTLSFTGRPSVSPDDGTNSNSQNNTSGDTSDEGTVEIAGQNEQDNPSQNNNQPTNGNNSPVSGGYNSFTSGYLLVKKEVLNQSDTFGPGDAVQYKITVHNPGDTTVLDVIVYDVLKNGIIEAEGSWPLEDVLPGEAIEIEYEIVLQDEATSGPYTNYAYASGFDTANAVIKSDIVTATIQVNNPDAPTTTSAESGSNQGNGQLASSNVNGQGGPDFGIIESFTSPSDGGTSDEVTTSESTNDGEEKYTDQSSANTTSTPSNEAQEALESELEQQIDTSSSIRRSARLTPIAFAAEAVFPQEGQQKASETNNGVPQVYGVSDSNTHLAQNVYPNFLHFDGMSIDGEEEASGFSYAALTRNWLFWAILALILLASWASYREKKRKLTNENRYF